MNKIIQRILILSVLLTSPFIVAGVAGNDALEQAKPDGWFWYKDKIPPSEHKKEPVKKEEKKIVVEAVSTSRPEKAEPFSATWVREKLPVLLDRAITDPSVDNVRAYKYLERLALDMASNYADMSEKVVRNDPMLDESVRFPISAMARQQALWKVDQAKKGIMQDLKGKVGFWMFFDSKCAFCHSQLTVMQNLIKKYDMEVRYISTDGGALKGMEGRLLYDKGSVRAKQLGIKLTPAIVMVIPPDNLAIVAHGAMALDELEQKIVAAAIDLNIANPALTNIAQLEARGILSHKDMMQVKSAMQDPEDTEELVKMVNGILRSKLGEE